MVNLLFPQVWPTPGAFLTYCEVTYGMQSLLQPDGALMPTPSVFTGLWMCPLVILESRNLLLRFADSVLKAQNAGWKDPGDQKLLRAVKVCRIWQLVHMP